MKRIEEKGSGEITKPKDGKRRKKESQEAMNIRRYEKKKNAAMNRGNMQKEQGEGVKQMRIKQRRKSSRDRCRWGLRSRFNT